MRGDVAFFTQPGHISGREKMFNSYDKGCELRNEANEARKRANSISNSVRVKGDAEIKHQAKRDYMTANVRVGDKINWMYTKILEVLKVNKKTFTLKGDFGNFTVDKCLCSLVNKAQNF